MKVVGSYELKLTFPVYLVLCLMMVPWTLFHWVPGWSLFRKGKKCYLAGLFSGLALVALCLRLLVFSPALEDMGIKISYYNTFKSYIHRGLALNFARSVYSSMLHEPEGYSVKRVEEIAKRYRDQASLEEAALKEELLFSEEVAASNEGNSPKEELTVSPENPNILVVINEAFSDLRLLGDFDTNEKPIPFLKSLKKQGTRHGVNFCSSYGGRTANTEMEFLTGLTMGAFPADSIPFQIHVKTSLPSLASYLGERGYVGVQALHPYWAKNYNREKAYPYLGFQESFF